MDVAVRVTPEESCGSVADRPELGGLLAIPWALNLHRDLRACLSVATAISLLLKGRMKHGTKDFCLHMDKAANEVC